MSASESRSSSAVRNLKAIFENKASEGGAPDSRGRSPNGIGSDKENGYRPQSKVRASFVPVQPVPNMSATVERRGSFGEADGDLDLKKTISEQQEQLIVPEMAVESVNPSAVGTPLRIPGEPQLGDVDVAAHQKADKEAANPDKPVTGAEEEPTVMKPADPSSEAAVSGGEALSPVAEDLRQTAQQGGSRTLKTPKAASSTTKPTPISTRTPAQPPANSIKSPATQPKTPLSAKATSSVSSPAAKRPPRSSLTAPTAASMARSGGSDKPSTSKTSPVAKSKPREVTKPLNISSHLTAPTASSKAKQEPEGASFLPARSTLVHRPKPAKPAARSSLAAGQRSQSRESANSARRSLAPVDGSFLDRMTRPTAASANRTTEKVEVKSSPKAKTAVKAKTNGHISKSAANAAQKDTPTGADTLAETAPGAETSLSFAGGANNVEDAVAAVDQEIFGSETPEHTNGISEVATPAGLGSPDTIR